MKKINYYIGSNKQTHVLETDKALAILSSHYEGKNVSELIRYWHGSKENTMLVSIVLDIVNYTKIKAICKELLIALDLQSIMAEVLISSYIK